MLELSEIYDYLKENIDEKRIAHSEATAKEAVRLARLYGADEHKALIAGLLHDVAKGKCHKGLKDYAAQYNIELDAIEAQNTELVHGKLGAAMVQKRFSILDDDLLAAIRWHTTGRANMSLLEKIIYIADITEPGRQFEGVERIRALANKDINKAMLCALEQVIGFVKKRGFLLHPKSVEAYQYYKEEIQKLDASI